VSLWHIFVDVNQPVWRMSK